MVLHYRNTLSDVAAFQLHHLTRSRGSLVAFALFFAFTLPASVDAVPHGIPVAVQAAVVLLNQIFWLGLVAGFWVVSPLVTSRWGSGKLFLTDHTITIEQEGLIEETSLNRSFVAWPGIHRVRATEKHIFVYVSGSEAHIIPRRACAKDDDWRNLITYVASCVTASHPAPR